MLATFTAETNRPYTGSFHLALCYRFYPGIIPLILSLAHGKCSAWLDWDLLICLDTALGKRTTETGEYEDSYSHSGGLTTSQAELPPLGFDGVWTSYFTSIINVFRSNAAVKSASAKVRQLIIFVCRYSRLQAQ